MFAALKRHWYRMGVVLEANRLHVILRESAGLAEVQHGDDHAVDRPDHAQVTVVDEGPEDAEELARDLKRRRSFLLRWD